MIFLRGIGMSLNNKNNLPPRPHQALTAANSRDVECVVLMTNCGFKEKKL